MPSAARDDFVRNHQAGVMYDPVVLPRDFHVGNAGPIGEKQENIFRSAPGCDLGLSQHRAYERGADEKHNKQEQRFRRNALKARDHGHLEAEICEQRRRYSSQNDKSV